MKHILPGTIRSKTPQETLSLLVPYLKNFGIQSISDDTFYQPIPCFSFQCVRPLSRSVTVTQGKGLTKELSMISALMEAVEFHMAENLPETKAPESYHDLMLKNEPVLEPQCLATYPDIKLNTTPIHWIQCEDLKSNQHRLLPKAYFDMDFTKSYEEHLYFTPISNGLASGNDPNEAIVHGILELIERHCIGLAKSKSIDQRLCNLVSVESVLENLSVDSKLFQLIHFIVKKPYQLRIEDLGSEFGIPCFQCEIQYDNFMSIPGQKHLIYSGSGAHFDKDIALSRALTEAVQSAMAILSGAKDNFSLSMRGTYPESRYPLHSDSNRDYKSIPSVDFTQTFDNDLQWVLSFLDTKGFNEAYTLNLTSAKYQIPVYFTAIPGMKYASM